MALNGLWLGCDPIRPSRWDGTAAEARGEGAVALERPELRADPLEHLALGGCL